MLTVESLENMEPRTIFAVGFTSVHDLFGEEPYLASLFTQRYSEVLRYAAIRGYARDWAVYVGAEYQTSNTIVTVGDKLVLEKHIRKVIECTDEAFKLYRR